MNGHAFLEMGVEDRFFPTKVQDSELNEAHAELVEDGTVLSSEWGCR